MAIHTCLLKLSWELRFSFCRRVDSFSFVQTLRYKLSVPLKWWLTWTRRGSGDTAQWGHGPLEPQASPGPNLQLWLELTLSESELWTQNRQIQYTWKAISTHNQRFDNMLPKFHKCVIKITLQTAGESTKLNVQCQTPWRIRVLHVHGFLFNETSRRTVDTHVRLIIGKERWVVGR